MKPSAHANIRSHVPVDHGGRYSVDSRDPDIIDFSSSISPAGMPAFVKSILRKGLDSVSDYPDPRSTDLIRGLSRYTGLPASRLVVGNGAIEIIYNFCSAFVHGKDVLIQAPTFGEYEAACRLAGARILRFNSMNLSDDLESFACEIPKNGCVFVCNPNNPTGSLLTGTQMSKIIISARQKSALVFVDECFIELVPGSDESILKLVKRHDNLLVLRSLTKSFGLAGIRIGYAASSGHVAAILNNMKIPWSISSLAQRAALAAISSDSHLSRSRRIIKREVGFLKSRISGIPGFECHNTAANFILIRTKKDSARLQRQLLRHKILVRDCRNFVGLDNHHVRVAVRSRVDNLRLVHALEAVA